MDFDFCYSPWFTLVFSFTFAEHTILVDKYFTTDFVIPIYSRCVFLLSVWRCLYSPILFQSARKGMSNNMSLPKIAAPGKAFSAVWYVEGMAHAALVRKSASSWVPLY
jgi:hypothetical protein